MAKFNKFYREAIPNHTFLFMFSSRDKQLTMSGISSL